MEQAPRILLIGATATLLVLSACCTNSIAGLDLNHGDGGDGGVDAGADAGPDAGADAGPPTPDAGFGACGPVSDLTTSLSYSTQTNICVLGSADFDGDGMLDLLAEECPSPGPAKSGLLLYFGETDGGLRSPVYVSASGAAAIADVNLDGLPDIVTGAQAGQAGDAGAVSVLLNEGDGGFAPDGPFTISGHLGGGVAAGDLNGDGRIDLVVGEDLHVAQILYAAADGGFLGPVDLPEISPALPLIAVGDLNGDGRADIVSTTTASAQVLVLLSLGDGGFQRASYALDSPLQWGPVTLLPRANHLPDIVVGEWDVGVAILANLGNGSFGEAKTYAIPGGSQFAIGDFNGDCLPDLASPSSAMSCQSGWPIAILYGVRDEGFSGPQLVTQASEGPWGIAVLGPVGQPRAFAVGDSCGNPLTVYGDASKH